MYWKNYITHLRISKTVKKCKQLFYWPDISSDVEQYISECETCLRFSRRKKRATVTVC